ncbi:MAG: amidase, partial [Acidiphilium sp. 21-62-4]
MTDIAPAISPDIDLVEMTLADAAAAFARGVTAETLAAGFLERIATYNPHYNAIIVMNPHALDDARAIDRRRASGEALGPLAGVPVVVKDTMDMAGLPTTAGWAPLSRRAGGVSLIPAWDSPVVRRLLAA